MPQDLQSVRPGGSAIAITVRSVAKVTSNYICGSIPPIVTGGNSFNGISCIDSDMVAKRNLILNCSSRQQSRSLSLHSNAKEIEGEGSNYLHPAAHTTLGLHTGFCVKHRAKLELVDNFIQKCDVGIYVGKSIVDK